MKTILNTKRKVYIYFFWQTFFINRRHAKIPRGTLPHCPHAGKKACLIRGVNFLFLINLLYQQGQACNIFPVRCRIVTNCSLSLLAPFFHPPPGSASDFRELSFCTIWNPQQGFISAYNTVSDSMKEKTGAKTNCKHTSTQYSLVLYRSLFME